MPSVFSTCDKFCVEGIVEVAHSDWKPFSPSMSCWTPDFPPGTRRRLECICLADQG
jgi:hypothetical protein